MQDLHTQPAILHNDQELPPSQTHCAGPEEIDNVEVAPEVHHDLELGHERLDIGDVGLGLDHLHGHGGHRLPGHDAAGLRLQDAAEGAGAEEDAEIESVSRELEIPE